MINFPLVPIYQRKEVVQRLSATYTTPASLRFKSTLSIECANDFVERVGGNPESEYLKPTRLLQLSNATLIRGSILDIAAASYGMHASS